MKILAFDQASITTGWALIEDGEYIDSGIIHKNDAISILERVPAMALSICSKIKNTNVDLVVIEDIQNQSNTKTVVDLARLQGGIIMYCISKHIKFKILKPTEWRSKLNYKQGSKIKRAELKQQSRDYVQSLGLQIDSEDECEAICIGVAANKLYG